MKKDPHSLTVKRTILFILIILWAFVISGFSARNGKESSGLSESIARSVVEMMYQDYTTLPVTRQTEIFDFWHIFVRKGAHFTEYGVFCVLVIMLLKTYKKTNKSSFALAIAISFLYASVDEFHQLFVAGRDGNFVDVLIDTAGAVVAAFIFRLIEIILRKK